MPIVKKIGNIGYWFITTVLVVFAIATVWSAYEMPGGYRLYVVQSGSMEPSIKTGSVVFVAKQKQYQVNDVITFSTSTNLKNNMSTITHRIFAIASNNGVTTYTTRGDANQAEDREKVVDSQILGNALFALPYLGYAVAFAKTQLGLIVLIVIPGTIIVYNEIVNIVREVRKVVRERNKNLNENKTT